VFLNLQLPSAASLQRTEATAHQIENVLANTPGIESTTSIVGFNLLSLTRSSYNAFFFVTLKEWGDRRTREEQYQFIRQSVNRQLAGLRQGIAFSFSPPAIPGVGTSGGFTFVLEDRSGGDVAFLAGNTDRFLAAARKRPELASVNTTFLPNVPQQFIAVDRDKVLKQGADIKDVYRTIQAFMGGAFINYFNRFGRQWQVYVEAEGTFRARAENVGQFYVRNRTGEMVPLSTFTRIESRSGPEFTMRYNLYRSAQIIGSASPGYSSAQAMAALEEVFAETMPPEMGYDYLGISFQEKKAQQGLSPTIIFGFSFLVVFLVLAALYESWSLPFSVLLTTPIAVFGAFFVLWLRRTVLGSFLPPYMVQIENNVYSQIGLVMLIGLTAKNAILIVEFAKDAYEQGQPLAEAALAAARLRLRPILMTSFAFVLGCVPLWTASGAGSVARQVMGTTVIGGMLAATLIAIFIIPVFFVVVERLAERKSGSGVSPLTTGLPARGER
jgi:HAE1 family hydrophobic/amphiphilic exporter-1